MKTKNLRVWMYGVLIAAATCLQYPLIYAFRSVWTAKFPAYVQSWPNDGRFTQLGVYGLDDGDTVHYGPMVQEMSRRLRPRDPYVLREGPAFPPDYVSYRLLGGLHRLTGNINATWFVARLIVCLLWFVLLYYTALLLSIPEPAALFCAAFGTSFSYVVGLYFLSNAHWSGGMIKTVMQTLYGMALYGRTEGVWRIPRPGLSHIGLYAAILVWARAAVSRGTLPWVLSGLCAGALAYVRIDVWSGFVGAACLFPVLQGALLRRWQWRWTIPAVLGLALGFPTLLFGLRPPEDFLLKAGMNTGGGADWMTLAYLPFIAWILSRRKDALTVFLSALLLTVCAICNSGLITGHSLYTPNWRAYGNIYLFLVSISLLPRRWLEHRGVWKTATACSIGAVIAINAGFAGIRYPWQGLPAAYDEAFRWLEANARPDSVVSALSPEVNALIPCFTPMKTVIGNGAPMLSNITARENVERIVFAVDILGGDPKAFFNRILDHNEGEMRYKLDRVKTDFAGAHSRYFTLYPANLLQEKLDAALTTCSSRRFPVHYVWVGPFERLWLRPGFPSGAGLSLSRVFSNGVVDLYRVK
jgi:hypothetical protein